MVSVKQGLPVLQASIVPACVSSSFARIANGRSAAAWNIKLQGGLSMFCVVLTPTTAFASAPSLLYSFSAAVAVHLLLPGLVLFPYL